LSLRLFEGSDDLQGFSSSEDEGAKAR
jgi:hypothetical protein